VACVMHISLSHSNLTGHCDPTSQPPDRSAIDFVFDGYEQFPITDCQVSGPLLISLPAPTHPHRIVLPTVRVRAERGASEGKVHIPPPRGLSRDIITPPVQHNGLSPHPFSVCFILIPAQATLFPPGTDPTSVSGIFSLFARDPSWLRDRAVVRCPDGARLVRAGSAWYYCIWWGQGPKEKNFPKLARPVWGRRGRRRGTIGLSAGPPSGDFLRQTNCTTPPPCREEPPHMFGKAVLHSRLSLAIIFPLPAKIPPRQPKQKPPKIETPSHPPFNLPKIIAGGTFRSLPLTVRLTNNFFTLANHIWVSRGTIHHSGFCEKKTCGQAPLPPATPQFRKISLGQF